MERLPFNPDGANEKMAQIREMPEDQFNEELNRMRNEFKAWALDNFHMPEEAQHLINTMPEVAASYLGNQLTLPLVYRDIAIDFAEIDDTTEEEKAQGAGRKKKRKVQVEVELNYDYDEQNGHSGGGTIRFVF